MKHWWQDEVFYQIYPKSYKDTNGDGIGDLPGIIEKLDYLKDLGIGAIWLSPIFTSPQADNGYDVADYEDIDPMFGTLEDLDELIAEADKRGIKIVLDLVLNHTSDEHYWFQEALKGKDNPYHDYYIWSDNGPDDLPNDIESAFGGPTWKYVPHLEQWYYHHYDVKQPDLDWTNPKMRQEIYAMINRWIDRGVGGFRLDVIDEIAKDIPNKEIVRYPEIYDLIEELSANCFQRDDVDVVTVGEVWSANPERAKRWSKEDGSLLSMVFQLEHSTIDQYENKYDIKPLNFLKLKETFSKWQTELQEQGWGSLVWENHDLPRVVSRWGNDKELRTESAKMFATLYLGLRGTPYIYQGQEIGMTNHHWRDISKYDDVEAINLFNERTQNGYTEAEVYDSLEAKGRDNARTPMQWDDSKNAGFTTGTPWIDVTDNYKEVNVASEVNDPKSIFNHYKNLIQLRKDNDVFLNGRYELFLANDEEVFAYKRTTEEQELLVICNFYGNTIERELEDFIGESELVLGNYEIEDINTLKPYEARMYLLNK